MTVEYGKPGDLIENDGKKIYIHVNQKNIRSNIKNDEELPVITIKFGKRNVYCNKVEILGRSEVLYSGAGDNKPLLPCGARVAMLTYSDVRIIE